MHTACSPYRLPNDTGKQNMKRDAESPIESENKKIATGLHPITDGASATMEEELANVKCKLNEDVGSITTKLGDVYTAQAQTMEAVSFHGQHLLTLSEELAALKLEVQEKDKVINKLTGSWRDSLNKMKRDVDENTKERRNRNMVINGLPESPKENCVKTVVEFLKKIVPTITEADILSAYRLGKKANEGSDYNRSTMVRFKDVLVKFDVMRKKSALKNSAQHRGIFCNDDLPEEKRRIRQKLRVIGKFASNNGFDNVQVRGDKIWVDGKVFAGDELHLLPVNLQPENIATRVVGNGIGFAGESSYLSNFFPCSLRMGNKSFCSSEQAFQYTKCLICEREDASPYILQVEDPEVIKNMGSKIFTNAEWESKKTDVMKCILLSKFGQNLELKAKLMATGTTPLYECTQSRFWGTGWTLDAPDWVKSSNFPGKNVLGKLLMDIRDNVEGSTSLPATTSDKEIGMDYEPTPPRENNEMLKALVGNGSEPARSNEQVGATASTTKPDEKDSNEEINNNSSREGTIDQEGEMLSHDSISFESSTYITENTSYTRKSVTRQDGSLDTAKLMNWSLPKLDLSALHLTKGGRKNHSFNPMEEATAVSTPVLIARNLKKFKQRKKNTVISHGDVSNKANMMAFMDKMLKK